MQHFPLVMLDADATLRWRGWVGGDGYVTFLGLVACTHGQCYAMVDF